MSRNQLVRNTSPEASVDETLFCKCEVFPLDPDAIFGGKGMRRTNEKGEPEPHSLGKM